MKRFCRVPVRNFLSFAAMKLLMCGCHSGVFITKGDVGVGTIVGSAVFNILVIIGLSGIFAGQVRGKELMSVWRLQLNEDTEDTETL